MDNPENKQTKFNAAIASLERLHNLLIDCNKYSTLSRVDGLNINYLKMWKYSVLSLFRELSPKISNKKEIYSLFKRSKEIGPIIGYRKTPNGPIREINPVNFDKHWQLVHKIETKLRMIADKKGMLIPDNMEFAGAALR